MTEKRDLSEPLSDEMVTIEDKLNIFSQFVAKQTNEQRGSLTDQWAWRYVGGQSDFHILVTVMIHGDEVGPLDGLLDVMDALESNKLTYDGVITCVVGNPEAGRIGQRFVDVDMNRIFSRDAWSATTDQPIPIEVKRAEQLMDYIDDCDLLIDFHQTIQDSVQAFYITPWSSQAWRWMRLMGGAKVWVTRHPERGGGGLKCADEYARQQGKPAIALELGSLGFTPKSRSGVWKSLSRALKAINSIHRGEASLEELAEAERELTFYETSYRARFDDPKMYLRDGVINFAEVEAGERLSAQNDQVPELIAPLSGSILFPKYPPRDEIGVALEPRPSEIYRIITPLEGHPLDLWGER